jgi:hypothetical protein
MCRGLSARRLALILATAGLLVAGAVASACAHWQPGTTAVHLENGQTIAVRRTKVDVRNSGTTWHGEIVETGEPVMMMRWNDGRFGGMLVYRGQVYTLKSPEGVGGSLQAVKERQSEAAGLGRSLPPDADRHDLPLASRSLTAVLRLRPRGRPGPETARAAIVPISLAERRALAAKKVTIDVMVLYTSRVASRYVDVETDLIEKSIDEANQSFITSDIGNIKLRLVHSEKIEYDESRGGHFDHLYKMVDGIAPFARVGALRDEHRADVVVLIVDDASSCGLATRVGADADEAFAVVHHACAALTYSLPHEIGHIIGARHDRMHDQMETQSGYGHGYVVGGRWRDIMTYNASCDGCPRLPFWSNPTITIKGQPGGTVVEDNARVLLEQAARVAAFR